MGKLIAMYTNAELLSALYQCETRDEVLNYRSALLSIQELYPARIVRYFLYLSEVLMSSK